MKTQVLLALAVSSLLVACNKQPLNDDEILGTESESSVSVMESAISNVTSSLDDAEQSEDNSSASCNLSRFSPLLGSANCNGTEDDETVSINYDGCTVENIILTGSSKLKFDSPATCSDWIVGGPLPTSGYTVGTSSDFKASKNGWSVAVDSNAHQNYLGETVSGGVKVSFLNGSRQVDILGIHRVGRTPKNFRFFDHSVYTIQPIAVSGYRFNGTRQIASGVIKVNHNIAEFTTEINLTGLKWSTTCCHPVDGQVQYSLSGNLAGQYSVNFATGVCGQVEVTKQGESPKMIPLSVCK